eukprot:Tbor_TRINITY_DN3086_c0_g2::TRINITY_DN3086_c0_g2_i1::g.17342::m.17342/K00898/PDK2_3_4; pyruvate dehydrogenase kinase 2/3/4
MKNLSPKHAKCFAECGRKQTKILLRNLAASEASHTPMSSANVFDIYRALSDELIIRTARASDAILSYPYNVSKRATSEMIDTSIGWFSSACELYPSHDCGQSDFFKKLEEIENPSGPEFLKSLIAVTSEHLEAPQAPLVDFCSERIAIKILCAHYRHLCGHSLKRVVEADIPLMSLLQDAAYTVKRDALSCFGRCPDIIIDELDKNITLVHVRDIISYIFSEILKNSARASLSNIGSDPLPIHTSIAWGPASNITITVADDGGGINDIHLSHIWRLGYSSSPTPIHDSDNVFCGYGVGLPLAKVYIELFGGSVSVVSHIGKGTSISIILPISGQEK